MKLARLVTAFAIGIWIATGVFAQDYPAKPVKVIVPFTAGGGVDVVARAVSQKLSELWGQSVTVENHVGASGTVGAGVVAKSPADGYTLLANTSAQAVNAVLFTKLAYDPLKDFVAIAPLASQPYVFVAGKSAGFNTVAELIAGAKANPGQPKFASAGIGTGTHLGIEKFNLEARIKAEHVPTAGGVEFVAETIAGE
jgi:tripartite-type tricarboxylate transporter receptor subunit TctC